MSSKATSHILTQAEGYLEIELINDALDTINSLPSEEQVRFPALALRVRILLANGSWQKAELLADTLIAAMPSNGGAWYALAQAQAQQENLDKAKASLKQACTLDTKLREPALRDPLLEQLW